MLFSVVSQETIGSSNINIYKPYNLEKTPSLIDTKNNSNETSLKLLTDYDNPSLEVRTGQQESIRQSLTNRSVICHSGGGPSQTRSGKLHSAQVHGNNASLPRSHEDLSTQRLVKWLQWQTANLNFNCGNIHLIPNVNVNYCTV